MKVIWIQDRQQHHQMKKGDRIGVSSCNDRDAAARLQHIEEIRPSANNGKVTTHDRIVFRIKKHQLYL